MKCFFHPKTTQGVSRLILSVFLSTTLFFLAACSSSDDDDSGSDNGSDLSANACSAFNFSRSKIANGQTCSSSGNPSPLVRLAIRALEGQGVCTGTVIDNDKILTAAHCLEGTILSIDVETDIGVRNGVSYVVPSTYRGEFSSFGEVAIDDIGIVFTSEAIGIAPSPILVSQSPAIGENAFIGGFGENKPGSLDATPRAGNVVIASVTPNHVFVRFEGDQAHPCRGDSGGPLVVTRSGANAIVGVVSQSDPSVDPDTICRRGDITLYTNVRSPSVLSFLAEFAPNAGAL